MPLVKRHRVTMLCDDAGGRLGSCEGSSTSIVAAAVVNRPLNSAPSARI